MILNEQCPLAGKKVAVLVESEYVPHQVRAYSQRFAGSGRRSSIAGSGASPSRPS